MSKNTNLSFLTDYITADITNGRIGINNASPAYSFDVTGIARTSTSTYLATASGNVGIGTTSPNLSSYGTALTLLAASGYGGIEVYGSGSTNGGQIDFGSGSTRFASISGEYESATNGYLNIRTRRAGEMTNAVRITSVGNVGVGTTDPNTYSFGGALLTLSSTTTFANIIVASSGANSSGISLGNQGTRRAEIEAADGSNLIFKTNNVNTGSAVTERMRITSAGNVGIGTSSPNGKLSVQDAVYGEYLRVLSGVVAGNQTSVYLAWNNGGNITLQQIVVGAADSGGSGFRVLRIPNT